jgi:hypothetical protein
MARPSQLPTQRPKRVRFQTSGSSDPAATSTADDSTVGSDQDSDSSELSESSEDPSSESSDDEDEDEALDVDMNERQGKDGVTNLRAGQGKKPTMKFDRTKLGPDIRIFLKDFLPQLKAANDELESHRKAGTLKSREIDMTDADDVEEYIEMVSWTLDRGTCMANVDQDLGLGVLEEKKANADDDASSESDRDDEMEGVEKEKDVLGKLLGRAGTKDNVVIQEVQAA